MGYDCVGDMECAKPYPLPKHIDPLNGDPQASKWADGGIPEAC